MRRYHPKWLLLYSTVAEFIGRVRVGALKLGARAGSELGAFALELGAAWADVR